MKEKDKQTIQQNTECTDMPATSANEKDPMELSRQFYEKSMGKVNKNGGSMRFVPSVLFLAFIFTMSVWFIFGEKAEYSSSEKRYLEKFPETTLSKIADGTFGEKFEKYFADHFPKRNFWVGFDAYYNLELGNNGANGVYHCKGDYLINKPVPETNNLEKNIKAVTDFKKLVPDTPLTLLFAPSTGYIISDALPDVHNTYNDDRYFDYAQKTLSDNGIAFVDLRQTFKDAYARQVKLYYRTDHHWTTSGAYIAYNRLCETLGVAPCPPNQFTAQNYDGFFGTTYSTSGFWLTPSESIQVRTNPANSENNITVTITEGTQKKEYHSLYFYDHLKEDDKYPVFLDGNHPLTTIQNTNAPNGTIILIKDSFSHCFAPFLAENYRKVILVDMRYYKQSVSQMITAENPEQVVVLYGIDNFLTDTDIVWLG